MKKKRYEEINKDNNNKDSLAYNKKNVERPRESNKMKEGKNSGRNSNREEEQKKLLDYDKNNRQEGLDKSSNNA